MRIAQIAPIAERVPPEKYGGIERVVYSLTEELIKRGHDVTLFASGDSITSGRLSSVVSKSLRHLSLPNPYGLSEWTFLHIGLAYQHQKEFDIIHDHNYTISMPTAALSATPVVMTVHGAFNESNTPLYSAFPNIHLVTISKAQTPKKHHLPIVGTVHHGIEMSHYPFRRDHNGYLLFIGRMAMEKGVHHAIAVAQALDMTLIIAARVDSMDMQYFRQFVKPHLSDKRIKFVGEVDETTRNRLMSRALCFLHPVTWPEPFGLTLIEAMACGCPVIGFAKGSIPELIQDGKTGFVVKAEAEMIKAVKNIYTIDRMNCRKYALNVFTPERMTEQYVRLYKNILQGKSREVKFPENVPLKKSQEFLFAADF